MANRNSYHFPSFQAQAPPSTTPLLARRGLTVSFASISTVSFASTTDESETSTIVVDPEDIDNYERTLPSTKGTPKKTVTFSDTDDVISPVPIQKTSSNISRVFSPDLKRRLAFRSSPPRTTADGATVHPRGRDLQAIKKKLSSSSAISIPGNGRVCEYVTSTGSSTSSSSTLVEPPLPWALKRVSVSSLSAATTAAISSYGNPPSSVFKETKVCNFADHIHHRTYSLKKLTLGPHHTCVALLDSDLEDIFSLQLPLPSPPSPQQHPNAKSLFALRETKDPFMGMGMFASINISHNELIDMEYPVIIIPYVEIGGSTSLRDFYSLVFEKLGADNQRAIKNFCGNRKDRGGSLCERIMCSNALFIHLPLLDSNGGIDDDELSTHRALFLNAGRLNHSCSPNARLEWDANTFTLKLWSVRDIAKGEQISIAYVQPFLSFAERRMSLKEVYGFECLCPCCLYLQSSHTKDANGESVNPIIETSDATREYLAHFWDDGDGKLPSFKKWCDDLSIPSSTLIEAHKNALSLIQSEGLEVLDTYNFSFESSSWLPLGTKSVLRNVVRHADAIAMCYGALEDEENFRLWIKLSLDARLGTYASSQEVFRKWYIIPHSFPAWGWRNRATSREEDCSLKMLDDFSR